MVTFNDPLLGRKLRVSADLLALSAGMVAEDTEELASIENWPEPQKVISWRRM